MTTSRLLTALCVGMVLAPQSGCYRTRIDVGGARPQALRAGPEGQHQRVDDDGDSRWTDGSFYHNAVFALVDFSGPLHLHRICPLGVDHIEQETTFLSGLIGRLTGGLYTPQYVKVVCVGGDSARLTRQGNGWAVADGAAPSAAAP